MELKAVVTRVKAYMQLHYNTLLDYKKEVRVTLLAGMNIGLEEAFHALFLRGEEL